MAIMPFCVVCGYSPDAKVAGAVAFADFDDAWRPPSVGGAEVIGWCNSLGVTAPEGVGLFCAKHLPRARRLRRRTSAEAVAAMRRRRRWPLSMCTRGTP